MTGAARRLAGAAHAARLRFPDPAAALRAWREIWAQACEITGDLAAALTRRLRAGSPAWRAARRLRHAAAEGAAHARGWLDPGRQLPAGSYDTPGNLQAPTWATADAATRLHDTGHGRLADLDFPGPLAGLPPRRPPRPRDRRHAARTAPARQPATRPAARR